MQTLTLSVLVTVGLVELGLCGWLIRGVRRQQDTAQRVSALTDALSLLAETSEAGFQASAVEIARLAERVAVRRMPEQRAPSSRVARGRRRGRTVEQVAADEQMSRSGTHLRLSLSDEAPDAGATMTAGRLKAARRGGAAETGHS